MNNAENSVPARIVIVGTSKIRLSERFNRIQTEKPQSTNVRKEDVLSINGGPVIHRPHVPPIERKPFLHDDYMDNNLYGEHSAQGPLLGRMRKDHAYQNASFNRVDPVRLTLDDYDTYNRMRPNRTFGSRYGDRSQFMYQMNADEEYYEYDTTAHALPVHSGSNTFRKPIQQRLSYRPPNRISDIALWRPIRNRVNFKRPFRGRFGAGDGNRRFNNPWSRRGAENYRKNRWGDRRIKKTVQEMDRELEEYMKSAKHPRVRTG